MMQYYLDILDDCADAQMMVNFHGCTWYVAGLNGDKTARTITIPLDFLNGSSVSKGAERMSKCKHRLTCIADGTLPNLFSITHRKVTSTDKLSILCVPQGGFTLIINKNN